MNGLSQLDELVLRFHRVTRRPGYRRRLLAGLTQPAGMGGLRVLRSVERRLEAGEAPSIGDVRADLEVEQSTASRAVTAMVQAGLITRCPSEEDQRRARLDLTEDGRRALARATRNRAEMLAEVTDGWSRDELALLGDLLTRLVAGYDDLEAARGR